MLSKATRKSGRAVTQRRVLPYAEAEAVASTVECIAGPNYVGKLPGLSHLHQKAVAA
jgi:hypothetical protein